MKKTIISLVLLAALLTGCMPGNKPADIIEYTEEIPDVNITEPTETAQLSPVYPEDYTEVLLKYQRAHSESWDRIMCAENGMSCQTPIEHEYDGLYYALSDLNDDGIDELMIAEYPYREDTDTNFIDIYTIVYGEVVHVKTSDSVFPESLCDGGLIKHIGAEQGDYNSYVSFWKLGDTGFEQDLAVYEIDGQWYLEGYRGVGSKITHEEAENIIANYPPARMAFTEIPGVEVSNTLTALLTGCARSNESHISSPPEQVTEKELPFSVSIEAPQEEPIVPELINSETELFVFNRVFLPVAGSSERIDLDEFAALLNQENLDFSDDEGIITVFENSCDESYLYAVLTNENGIVEIAQLGYHYKTADDEYGVMVDWSEKTPRYLTDVTMPDSGTEVTSLAAVESYIVDAALRASSNEAYSNVEEIVKEFADAYFVADSDVMKKHLSRTRNVEFTVYEGGDPDKVVINAIKGLENISADIEQKGYCNASVEFKKSAESDYYIYLTIEIILEDNQWKIAYYTLEM